MARKTDPRLGRRELAMAIACACRDATRAPRHTSIRLLPAAIGQNPEGRWVEATFVVVVGERGPRTVSSRIAQAIQMEGCAPAVPRISELGYAALARSGCANLCALCKLLFLRLHSVALCVDPGAFTDRPGLGLCDIERCDEHCGDQCAQTGQSH